MLTFDVPFLFATDLLVEERPAACQILLLLEEGGPRPLTFVLNANLVVNVKIVTCMFYTHRIRVAPITPLFCYFNDKLHILII